MATLTLTISDTINEDGDVGANVKLDLIDPFGLVEGEEPTSAYLLAQELMSYVKERINIVDEIESLDSNTIH